MGGASQATGRASVVVVDLAPGRLDRLREIVAPRAGVVEFDYVCTDDPRRNDELLAALPEGSLVINATGMGKDRPGSPLTDRAVFPRRGIAWELNYRGELLFLHQARRQQETRQLRVEDGWLYFLRGWADVISLVLGVEIDASDVRQIGDSGRRGPVGRIHN